MESERDSVLITGANGFVGRHLISALLAAGEKRVVAAVHPDTLARLVPDTQPAAGWDGTDAGGRVEVVPFDLSDPFAVEPLVKVIRPRAVYHLAARASGADSDRQAVFDVNVSGTRHLLEAAAHLNPFPRVLAISTGYVYGNTDPARPAREEDPVGPLWKFGAYTDSKIEMETVARANRAYVIVARAFTHTGPGQAPQFSLSSFARQLARIEKGLEPPVLHVGNLSASRDLLDVRDVVAAYRLLMERGKCGEFYNVANGAPITIGEALDRLRAFCSVETTVEPDPARMRPADIGCSTGDSFLLRDAAGWQPRYTLDETLPALLDYWRKVEG